MTKKRVAGVAVFLVLAGLIVAVTSALFLPSFRDTAGYNDETVRGLYHQPANTVQVAFLGTSTVLSGVSPMALYDEHGICSYNVGTRAQPFIMSYYLLKDIERRNPDTLSTVVIDPSYIFHTSTAMSRVEETVNYMDPSPVKLEAMLASAEYYENFDLLEHLVPVLRYHSRWNELTPFDFETLVKGDGAFDFSRHGYYARFNSNLDYEGTIISTARNEEITDEITHDDEEIVGLYDRGKVYLDKIVDFCDEKGLNLVFLKIPKAKWDSLSHDGMKKLADDYGIPFVDMDLSEIWDECGLSYDTDYVDNRHPNVSGASKITRYVGDYLAENYDIPDVRGDARYSFMEGDLGRYRADLEDAELLACDSFEDYLRLLDRDRYTAFIAVKGEAVDGLSESARAYLADELGLTALAGLQEGQSYVGVLRSGERVNEKIHEEGKTVRMRLGFDGRELVTRGQKLQSGAVIDDGYILVSAGTGSSSKANVTSTPTGEIDLSENRRGINFVVYDHETGYLIDTSSFDTHNPDCPRTSDRVTE